MKHASAATVASLEPLLRRLRDIPGLVERKPGTFYRGGSAFLHFHEDPAGLYADAKLDLAHFERWPVNTDVERTRLLRAVTEALGRRSGSLPTPRRSA